MTLCIFIVMQMLNSIQGMVDRTRQAMAVLKERINITHLEMERQEVRTHVHTCAYSMETKQ